MKFAFKSVVVAVAFVAAGAANAATVTVDNVLSAGDDYTVSGYGALTFSTNLRNALNVGAITTSPFGGAQSQIVGAAGAYTDITVSAPVTSVTYDDVTNQVISVKTAGGARQDAKVLAGVSNGGWVEVGNLDANLQTKEIFGTVVGQSLAGVAVNWSGKLFDFASVTGDTSFAVGMGTTTLTKLALTSTGFAEIQKALDLQFLGEVSLQAASTDFGNIAMTFGVPLLPVPTPIVPSIPEPSTYALMGLGLVGLALARRRAAK